MKRSKFTDDQIPAIVREGEAAKAAGLVSASEVISGRTRSDAATALQRRDAQAIVAEDVMPWFLRVGRGSHRVKGITDQCVVKRR